MPDTSSRRELWAFSRWPAAGITRARGRVEVDGTVISEILPRRL